MRPLPRPLGYSHCQHHHTISIQSSLSSPFHASTTRSA